MTPADLQATPMTAPDTDVWDDWFGGATPGEVAGSTWVWGLPGLGSSDDAAFAAPSRPPDSQRHRGGHCPAPGRDAADARPST